MIGAALLGAGFLLLLTAIVPWLPFAGEGIPAPDAAAAQPVLWGLGFTLAAAALFAFTPEYSSRVRPVLAAAFVPVAVVLVAVIANGPDILSTRSASATAVRRLLLSAVAAGLCSITTVILLTSRPDAADVSRFSLLARLEPWILVVVLAAFGVAVFLGIRQGAPFLWDEAVYALLSRHWLEGTPSTGWGVHRSPGLSALGMLPVALGRDEWLFRLVGMAGGLATIVAAWYLGRVLAAPPAGLFTALSIAAISPIAENAGFFLTDLTAAALLLFGMALLLREMERSDPVSWQVLWLAPLIAGAFYLRYASVIPVLAVTMLTIVLWPARLVLAWRKVVATVALFLVLLLPYAIFASAQTGSPLGILLQAKQSATPGTEPGLLLYVAWLPKPLVGIVPGALAILGLSAAIFYLVRRAQRLSNPSTTRALAFLSTVAVLQILTLGLTIHAEARYIFLAMILLITAGAVTLASYARRQLAGRVVLGLIAGALSIGIVNNTRVVPEMARRHLELAGWQREVGLQIGERGNGSCSVIATDVPTIAWYSGCRVVSFGESNGADQHRFLRGHYRFLVARSDGKRQPPPGVMADYFARTVPVRRYTDERGRVVARLFQFSGRMPQAHIIK